MTVEDPESDRVPYARTGISIWQPDLKLLEFQCEENLKGAREGLTIDQESK